MTFNLIFLLKIQILASFSFQAFMFTHFPTILQKKKSVHWYFKQLSMDQTLSEDNMSDYEAVFLHGNACFDK